MNIQNQTTEIFDMELFTRHIEEQTGMKVPQANRSTINKYIIKKTRELDINAQEYYNRLKNLQPENLCFLNNSTINETYFFREEKHFTILKNYILPDLSKISSNIRIWSAACSSGEEPVSLAICAEEFLKKKFQTNYTVYASDLNTDMLNKLSIGEYGNNSFRQDGKAYRYLLDNYSESNKSIVKINKEILNKIVTIPINLFIHSYDAIPNSLLLVFFRNTFIYLCEKARILIIDKIVEKIQPGGCFFCSCSEVPMFSHHDLLLLEIDGSYFFQKKSQKFTSSKGVHSDGY